MRIKLEFRISNDHARLFMSVLAMLRIMVKDIPSEKHFAHLAGGGGYFGNAVFDSYRQNGWLSGLQLDARFGGWSWALPKMGIEAPESWEHTTFYIEREAQSIYEVLRFLTWLCMFSKDSHPWLDTASIKLNVDGVSKRVVATTLDKPLQSFVIMSEDLQDANIGGKVVGTSEAPLFMLDTSAPVRHGLLLDTIAEYPGATPGQLRAAMTYYDFTTVRNDIAVLIRRGLIKDVPVRIEGIAYTSNSPFTFRKAYYVK